VPLQLLPDTARAAPDGALTIGGVALTELAATYGTPLFVYDETHVRNRCREALDAFGAGNVTYASKAFLCVAMARLAHEEGLSIDVATGGELHVALAAGVPGSQLVLHGNNKSEAELRQAIGAGVHRIVVDSFDELDRLDALHAEGLPRPRIQLRITPGVEAHTHEFVRTGQEDSKFGFGLPNGSAAAAAERALASPAVELVGFHAHVGSQVFAVESFARVAELMAVFARPYGLPTMTVGGGLGVAYVEGESLLMGINDIAVSSGSACTSATLEPSYVLKGLGAGDDLAHSSIRFGIGRFNTEAEVDYVANKLIDVVLRLRELSPLYEMAKEGIDLKTVKWAGDAAH
jgi:diaminopimelate decarboxylase